MHMDIKWMSNHPFYFFSNIFKYKMLLKSNKKCYNKTNNTRKRG